MKSECVMVSDDAIQWLLVSLKSRIVHISGQRVLAVSDEGIFALTSGSRCEPYPLDLSVFEPFDELLYLPKFQSLLFAEFGASELILRLVHVDLESYALVPEAKLSTGVPGNISTLVASPNGVAFYVDDSNGGTMFRVTLENQFHWTLHSKAEPHAQLDGELAAVSGDLVVTEEDQTPFPPLIRMYHRGELARKLQSERWTVGEDNSLYAVDPLDGRLMIVKGDGSTSWVDTPGVVTALTNIDSEILAVVNKNSHEVTYRVTMNLPECSAVWTPVDHSTGKKQPLVTAPAVLVGDTSKGLYLWPATNEPEREQIDLGSWPQIKVNRSLLVSPEGAQAIVLDPVCQPTATFLHFHGGPDSHEVEELRFFGLTRCLIACGIRIVVLNYRGSTCLPLEAHMAAWRRWHITVPEDLKWLSESGALVGPSVAAGWSFGGALAFIAGQTIQEISGVVMGGSLTDLTKHRNRAANASWRYDDWFTERFGPAGEEQPCERLFRLRHWLDHPVPVLSFHGKDDLNCSYEDLDELRPAALSAGYQWEHHDLKGGGHDASEWHDAKMVHDETERFVVRLLTEMVTFPQKLYHG